MNSIESKTSFSKYTSLLSLAGTDNRLILRVPPEDRLPYIVIAVINTAIYAGAGFAAFCIADNYFTIWLSLLIAAGVWTVYYFSLRALFRLGNKYILKVELPESTGNAMLRAQISMTGTPLFPFLYIAFAIVVLNVFAALLLSIALPSFLNGKKLHMANDRAYEIMLQQDSLDQQIQQDSLRLQYLKYKSAQTGSVFGSSGYSGDTLLSIESDKVHYALDSMQLMRNRLVKDVAEAQMLQYQILEQNSRIIRIVFIVCIVIFNASLVILYARRRDFYHHLLNEEEFNKLSNLTQTREEIVNKIKLETKVTNLKASLSRDAYDDEDLARIKNNLTNADDAISQEALADFHMKVGEYEEAISVLDEIIKRDPESARLWKKKSEALKAAGRTLDADDAEKRFIEFERKAQFTANLADHISLKSISLRDITNYKDLHWELKPGVNILLGRNGYGKTHLMTIALALLQREEEQLRALIAIEAGKEDKSPDRSIEIDFYSESRKDEAKVKETGARMREIETQRMAAFEQFRQRVGTEGNKDPKYITEQQAAMQETMERLQKETDACQKQLLQYSGLGFSKYTLSYCEYTAGRIPVFAIPDMRFVNKSLNFTNSSTDERVHNMLENGAYHFINQLPYEGIIQNFLNIIANLYLKNLNFADEVFALINRVFRRLTGDDFEWVDVRLAEAGSGYSIKVKTESGTDLPIQKVSQGTLSVISIVGLLYYYLSLRFPKVDRKLLGRQKALVFIDEIDAHLHPLWQQKIIGILKREFPNIQFVISAHSPQIVAGCKEGEVSVMRKSAGDGFIIKTLQENFIGMSLDDIFRKVFETEEKDETFREILALLPFTDAIRKKIDELEAKTTRTPEQEVELLKLQDQMDLFIYFDQVTTDNRQTDKLADAQAQIEILRMEKADLEAALAALKPKTTENLPI